MNERSPKPDRARDFDRFLTFIDAIVAIAITLLVLPLVDLAGDLHKGGSVGQLLEDHLAPIGAFVLSFLVIAHLWLTQHKLLHDVVSANRTLVRLLLLWSLTIVALPFPTALAAEPDATDQTATKALYVGTMAASSFVLSVACLVVARHDRLRGSPEAPDVGRSFATSVTFLVILAVMLLAPSTHFWPLLLLVVPDRAYSLWRSGHRSHA